MVAEMKISVAMATYNGEKYIVEQLDSIRKQSRPVDEVIIFDDCSNDSTVQIVEEFIQNNNLSESWKIRVNEKNQGYANNFYNVLRATTGAYIFLCDQDDIWVEDRVEKMLEVMEAHADIMLLGSEFEPFYVTDDAPTIGKNVLKKFVNDKSLEKITLDKQSIFIGSEGCTMCVRRSFLDNAGTYWFDSWAHDEFLWKLALAYNGCYIYHATTLLRRMHSNNVSKRKMHSVEKRIRFLEQLKRSHEKMLECMKELNSEKELLNLVEKNAKNVELRVALLKEKKWWNCFLLLVYLPYYEYKKSYLVELKMALLK